MPRSVNGSGSIRKRPDGRYEARYTGPEGKQHSVYAKTSRECAQKLRAAQTTVDNNTWTQPSNITLSAWLDHWLTVDCSHIRPSTLIGYRHHIALISSAIGHVRLTRLTSAHVRLLIDKLIKSGLASTTVNLILHTLSASLSSAVSARVIHDNPAYGIRIPHAAPVGETHIIDRPQFPAFFAASAATNYGPELNFLLLTGLRAGELIGLTWDCVDLTAPSITVRQQYSYTARALAPTKNSIIRTIHIVPQAADILKAQRARNAALQLKSPTPWPPADPSADYVFRSPHGGPVVYGTLFHAARAVGKALSINNLHPHDLRHSYAVAALRAGVDPKTVQNNLGHASAAMTLDVYARYTTDAGKTAAATLAAYLTAQN